MIKLALPGATATSVAQAMCRHCSQPSAGGDFCCPGCEAVYGYIHGAGWGDYYRLRQKFSQERWQAVSAEDEAQWRQQVFAAGADGLREFVWQRHRTQVTYAFYVANLTCAACLWLIKAALIKISGVAGVEVNFDQRLVLVSLNREEGDASSAHLQVFSEVVTTLARIGYRPYPPKLAANDDQQRTAWRRDLIDLAISGAVFGNVMLFAAAVYLGRDPGELSYLEHQNVWQITPEFRLLFDIMSAFLAGFSLLLVGRRFFATAWHAAKARMLHIDQPISFALALAYLVSVVNLWRGSSLLYFDSVAGLIFLLLIGRVAAARLAWRAQRLADAAVASIPLSSLRCGEEFAVAAGEVVLADGVVIEGQGELSEAALTGEQQPVVKQVGDRVLAGSLNFTSPFKVRATQDASASYVHQVRQVIEGASQHKPELVTMAERVLRWFMWAIYLVAVLAVLLWYQHGFGRALEVLCAVLIVACPCALALATPLTMSFALKRAWQHGVIIKRQDVIDRLARINCVVLDKTATLTSGQAQVVASSSPAGMALSDLERIVVSALARQSRHPVSRAIAAHLGWAGTNAEGFVWREVKEEAGQGLVGQAHFGSEKICDVRIGRAAFIAPSASYDQCHGGHGVSITWRQVFIADSGVAAEPKRCWFTIEDPLRDDAARLVSRLQRCGLEVHLLSGDQQSYVERVATELGIASWLAEATPQAKAAYIGKLADAGRHVMMVGDGINDAEALALADVGVAVKGGADLALSSADVFLARHDLAVIDEMFEYGRYTRHTLGGVIGFSLAYNVIAVGLALAGILHPLAAAVIMPLSSLTVVTATFLRKGSHLWKSSLSWCPLP